jgi:hypothetical protein
MRRIKRKGKDRLLLGFESPLMDELGDEELEDQDVVISGDLGVGERGNPVSIVVEDEVTGELLEMNHVESAFVIVEDKRKNSSGWLAVAIGEVGKLSKVLSFLAETTLDKLKKMVRRN